ncbi:MAG: hypothetical protein HPY61_08345 [Methanotrichaceae archaeon]|nr:hypothetical protein [Methanotrichaceae archaeon]
MAGVLRQFSWPFARKGEICGPRLMPADPRVPELETAKEILAEVFEIETVEVEEMIRKRCEDAFQGKVRDLWPDRLWVKEASARSGQGGIESPLPSMSCNRR